MSKVQTRSRLPRPWILKEKREYAPVWGCAWNLKPEFYLLLLKICPSNSWPLGVWISEKSQSGWKTSEVRWVSQSQVRTNAEKYNFTAEKPHFAKSSRQGLANLRSDLLCWQLLIPTGMLPTKEVRSSLPADAFFNPEPCSNSEQGSQHDTPLKLPSPQRSLGGDSCVCFCELSFIVVW